MTEPTNSVEILRFFFWGRRGRGRKSVASQSRVTTCLPTQPVQKAAGSGTKKHRKAAQTRRKIQHTWWPTCASTRVMADFGQIEFGQTECDCCAWCVVCGVLCMVCGVFVCSCVCVLCDVGTGFTISWCGVSRVGVGFKVLVWSCEPPKKSLFFPLPSQNSFFSSLSG